MMADGAAGAGPEDAMVACYMAGKTTHRCTF